MRTNRIQCNECSGKGYTGIVLEVDWISGREFERKIVCRQCKGTGIEIKKHDDLIKCTCGKSFKSMADLGAHRKSGC